MRNRDPELDAIKDARPDGTLGLYRAVTASDLLRERSVVLRRLERMGVRVVDAAPRDGRALFLDRDGTLIIDKVYLADPEGVELIPGAAARVSLRLQKEAVHELGHTFGLIHCDTAGCVMTRSVNLLEVDAKRVALCELCEARFVELRHKDGHHEQGTHAHPRR